MDRVVHGLHGQAFVLAVQQVVIQRRQSFLVKRSLHLFSRPFALGIVLLKLSQLVGHVLGVVEVVGRVDAFLDAEGIIVFANGKASIFEGRNDLVHRPAGIGFSLLHLLHLGSQVHGLIHILAGVGSFGKAVLVVVGIDAFGTREAVLIERGFQRFGSPVAFRIGLLHLGQLGSHVVINIKPSGNRSHCFYPPEDKRKLFCSVIPALRRKRNGWTDSPETPQTRLAERGVAHV